MAERVRMKHKDLGVVKDVPNTKHYTDNGWSPVDPSTPTTEQVRVDEVNAARRGDLLDKPAADVVRAMESMPEVERENLAAAEKAGKGRKSVIEAAE